MIIDQFINKEKQFLEKEFEIEQQEYEQFYKECSMEELVKLGYIITNLEIFKSKQAFFRKTLLTLATSKSVQNANWQEQTKIKVNDNVIIKESGKMNSSGLNGVVYKLKNGQIHILMNQEEFDKIENQKQFMLLKSADNVTYDRIRIFFKDLEKYKEQSMENSYIVTKVLTNQGFESQDQRTQTIDYYDDTLNDIQKNAVSNSIISKYFYLIHGPPGTGKTKTLSEICKQLVKRDKKLLICSPSNTGIDNLLIGILKNQQKITITRVGNPSRANISLYDQFLDVKMKNAIKKSPEYKEMKMRFSQLTSKRQKYQQNSGNKKELYQTNKEISNLIKEMYELEKILLTEIFDQSQIIASTLSSIYDKKLQSYIYSKSQRKLFDYVVIDEAGQSLNCLLISGIIQGKKFIMAGDHKQLPPTIKQKELSDNYVTIFEKLFIKNESFSSLLRIQYRMNQKIMNISSEFLYDKKLIADQSIAQQSIGDSINSILFSNSTSSLLMIDTFGFMLGEEIQQHHNILASTSKTNLGECYLVSLLTQILIKEYSLKLQNIGIITPYSGQVGNLKRKFTQMVEMKYISEIPEISTVDGFQGREKEVIILSTVRSNKNGNVGFLRDQRRMNVAITRAQKLLCLVGDSNTIQNDKFMKFLVEQIKENGVILKADHFEQTQFGQNENLQDFYQSGVFIQSAKKQERVPKKNKKAKKVKIIKKQESPVQIDNNKELKEFFREELKLFLQQNKQERVWSRKMNQQEIDALNQICGELNLDLIQGKICKVINRNYEIKQQKNKIQNEELPQSSEETLNQPEIKETKQIQKNENQNRQQKRKKQKKTKQVKLTEEEQAEENMKFLEQIEQERQQKEKVCHAETNGKICGKKISLLYQKCKFCNCNYCTYHGIPEEHGCEEAAKFEARQEHYFSFKDRDIHPISDTKINFLKQKVHKKLDSMKEAQNKKTKKNKKK